MVLSPALQKVYTKENKSAKEAQRLAERIAWGPVVFQVSRLMVKLGILELLGKSREGLTWEEICRRTGPSGYAAKCLLEASLCIGTVLVDTATDRFTLSKTGWFLLNDQATRVNMDFAHDVNYQGWFRFETVPYYYRKISNNMKKALFLFLAAVLPMMACAYDAKINGIYYNFNDSAKTATVTYYQQGGMNLPESNYSGTVDIPATVRYNGITYDVTTIGSGAFCRCSDLTSVTIPNSVTTIENGFIFMVGLQEEDIYFLGAFSQCSGLTSITIPNSVTSIGLGAFADCSSLTSVEIPNSVTNLGSGAFTGCSGLTSVTIPNGVTSINGRTFDGCNNLSSITIPNSVASIGEYAFRGCSSLTSVTIQDGVTSIGGGAFYGCTSLSTITIPNSVTCIENCSLIAAA